MASDRTDFVPHFLVSTVIGTVAGGLVGRLALGTRAGGVEVGAVSGGILLVFTFAMWRGWFGPGPAGGGSDV